MRVALDATPLTEPTGGIRRYTAELARALAEAFPEDRCVLVSDQSYQYSGPDAVEAKIAEPDFCNKRWWTLGLPRFLRREKIDVFHGTDFAVPYIPTRPSVMTVHDLSPWRFEGSARVRRRTPWQLRLGLATMVITPTGAVRDEVIDFFGVAPEEVVAIPLAAGDRFRPMHHSVAPRPYFLYVGSFQARKNLRVIVQAWREARMRREVDLVLVGRGKLTAPPDMPGLIVRGEVPEDELHRLYAQAVGVLCPSLYEGFCLPVLEAMQCGAATITSKDPAIVEVAGNGTLQLDANDVRGWRYAMEGLLVDMGERSHWQFQGLCRSRVFSWRRTAEMTRQVYEKAMRRFHG
jgi:glycosyltransferase involved in cell wall biosynthesis